jgi:acyl carrier protein
MHPPARSAASRCCRQFVGFCFDLSHSCLLLLHVDTPIQVLRGMDKVNPSKVQHSRNRPPCLQPSIVVFPSPFFIWLSRPFSLPQHSPACALARRSHPMQVTPTAHFTNDLGLDSLDVVEVTPSPLSLDSMALRFCSALIPSIAVQFFVFARSFWRLVPAAAHPLPPSLAQVVLAIEEEFAIEISHEDSERVNTVADAIAYISSHAHVSRPCFLFRSPLPLLSASLP